IPGLPGHSVMLNLDCPPPDFVFEIGVASEVVAQSILRVLGSERGSFDATVQLVDQVSHPLSRAHNDLCLVRTRP
ncbi:MAG: hypothetical protein Q9204_006755, partial [Flavoplaca sp. TL-2023a]